MKYNYEILDLSKDNSTCDQLFHAFNKTKFYKIKNLETQRIFYVAQGSDYSTFKRKCKHQDKKIKLLK